MSSIDLSSKYIPATKVREICGGVSQMTLSRWLSREDINFPEPVRIGNRRYFVESEIRDFMTSRRRSA